MQVIRSRDNPRVRRWRALLESARARRAECSVLVEGPHLVAEAIAAGSRLKQLLVKEPALAQREVAGLLQRTAAAPVVLSERVFDSLSELETPGVLAAEIELPREDPEISAQPNCVFLERIQDAGNMGAILRSAAAFGVGCVVWGVGCADPWSGKVLRAGQGGHFRLKLARSENLHADVARFRGKLVCTAPSGGRALQQLDLAAPLAWIFGSEGGGVSAGLAARSSLLATIPMPGGLESLNVAAAAAICFYEAVRQMNQA